jgi:signal transduction histidine kinase
MSVAALISYYAAGYPPIGVAVPLAAAVFSAAEFGRMGAAVIASIVVITISVVYRLAIGQDPAYVVYELPGHALLLAGAIALGDSVRSRRELRRQGARIAELTAERFARQAEQRVMAERLAIARELHDSVGHALTVVALHTQVVEEALGTDEGEARRSLKAIADTTAATFGDLRRTVASLRKEGVPVRSPHRLSDLDSATLPASRRDWKSPPTCTCVLLRRRRSRRRSIAWCRSPSPTSCGMPKRPGWISTFAKATTER